MIIKSTPGAADTAKHTSCKQNKNLFHSRGHSSILQSRSGEPLCIFSLYLCASILQTQTVNHIRLANVREVVNHLQNRQSVIRQTVVTQLREVFVCTSVCDRYVVDINLTSPTYWRRLAVRSVPSILLMSAHSTFFSLMSEFFSSCRRPGNSHRPASKPVNANTR